jgi:hypothetical protein
LPDQHAWRSVAKASRFCWMLAGLRTHPASGIGFAARRNSPAGILAAAQA